MTQWRDIEHLVHDRLDGALTPEQARSLDAILAREPDLARHAEELERVVRGLHTFSNERAPQDFARGVMQRLGAASAPITRPARTWGMRSIGPSLLAAAAVVVVAVVLARDPAVTSSNDRSVALQDASERDSADGFAALRGGLEGAEKKLDDGEVEDRRADIAQPPAPATAPVKDEVAQDYGLLDEQLAFRRDELVDAVTTALAASELAQAGEGRKAPAAERGDDSERSPKQKEQAKDADKDRKEETEKHKLNKFGADELDAAPALPDVIVVRRIADDGVRAQREAAADTKYRQRTLSPAEVLDALFGPAERGRAKVEYAKKSPRSELEFANEKLEALLASNADRARRVTLDPGALADLATKARASGLELYAWNRSNPAAAWKEPAATAGRLGAAGASADARAAWRKIDVAASDAPAVDELEANKKPARKAAAAPAARSVIVVLAQK